MGSRAYDVRNTNYDADYMIKPFFFYVNTLGHKRKDEMTVLTQNQIPFQFSIPEVELTNSLKQLVP